MGLIFFFTNDFCKLRFLFVFLLPKLTRPEKWYVGMTIEVIKCTVSVASCDGALIFAV